LECVAGADCAIVVVAVAVVHIEAYRACFESTPDLSVTTFLLAILAVGDNSGLLWLMVMACCNALANVRRTYTSNNKKQEGSYHSGKNT